MDIPRVHALPHVPVLFLANASGQILFIKNEIFATLVSPMDYCFATWCITKHTLHAQDTIYCISP